MIISDPLQVFAVTWLPLINSVMIIGVIFYVWYRGSLSVKEIKKGVEAIDKIQASVDTQVDKMAAKVDKTATKVEKVVTKVEEVASGL